MCNIPFITGHRTFDFQSDAIFIIGNAVTDTQRSLIVRPVHKTKCNGATFPAGELFKLDIRFFGSDLDQRVVPFVRGLKKKAVVYQLRHWVKARAGRRAVVHGHIVTDQKNRVLQIFRGSKDPKSLDIIDAAIDQIQAKK